MKGGQWEGFLEENVLNTKEQVYDVDIVPTHENTMFMKMGECSCFQVKIEIFMTFRKNIMIECKKKVLYNKDHIFRTNSYTKVKQV